MKRRISLKTLEKKIQYWQKVLKLDGWKITAVFKPQHKLDPQDPDTAAQVVECWPLEKVAVIEFATNYPKHDGYEISWNIDTLILHELIHVLCWEKTTDLPENIQDHSKFQIFEEFLCNTLSKIIYDNIKIM